MAGRPSFQFYPADWRKDAELQSCSIGARGLWHEALCIMNECEPYGYLTVNAKAMTAAQLGRLVGLSTKDCAELLDELIASGVPSIDEQGRIYSRRMVRDEKEREAWRKRQGKSRDKAVTEAPCHADVTAESRDPHALSSIFLLPSSSSTRKEEKSISSAPAQKRGRSKDILNGHLKDFEEFYAAFPKHVAKGDAMKAYAAALKLAEPAVILAGAQHYARNRKDEDHTFTKLPGGWLRAQRWLDEAPISEGNAPDPEFEAAVKANADFIKSKGYT